jgi:TrmH family RNA methyltransferase
MKSHGEQNLISSRSNPVIKRARALREHKARARTGLFLVEGIHHVGEAIEAGWSIDTILYAPDKLRGDFARSLISRFSGRLEAVSAQTLEAVAEKENPQGIVAIVHQRDAHLTDLPATQRAVALVSPQDPGNVGAILRTLDAVGGDAIFLLDGGVDPYHPTAIRASLGACFWKPMIEAGFEEFDAWRSSCHCQLIGASAGAAQDFRRLSPKLPWILLLGSEQKGLTPGQKLACDALVSLPMHGRASSLNLAVAAGILLYHYSQ